MPIREQSKIILLKMEAVYGTDPNPTGAANAVLMKDAKLVPMEGEDVSRDLELPYLGGQAMIPTGLRGRLTGMVEMVPSGAAGTAPAWGPLLRCCAVAETITGGVSVVYNPISDNMESATIYWQQGATRHVLTGCRGTATIKVGAQGLPYIEFDILGLWSQPTEEVRPTPDLSAYQSPVLVTNANTPTFTVNGVSMVMREMMLALNNQVEPRLLVGSEGIVIPNREDALSATVEAVPLTTFDPYALAQAQTLLAVNLVHGTVAGKITSLSLPTCQMKRLSGLQNAQEIVEWPLELSPLPAAGNDQWTINLT
ncbi:MAG: hypothetical protein QM488_18545 [Rhizobiaceae bacterium]